MGLFVFGDRAMIKALGSRLLVVVSQLGIDELGSVGCKAI